MASDRPSIPMELQRRLLVEASHRCAIPRCTHYRIEFAHIIPWKQVKEHKFENLIVLCPNCHAHYDKDKKIDRKAMQIYKKNLGLLNHRYGELERRILQYFLAYPNKEHVFIPGGLDLLVYYLVKDGFLLKTDINSGISSEIEGLTSGPIYSWKAYRLSDSGKLFVKNWEDGIPLD